MSVILKKHYSQRILKGSYPYDLNIGFSKKLGKIKVLATENWLSNNAVSPTRVVINFIPISSLLILVIANILMQS